MSEGRDKPLSLESIFNQSPEFYQYINGNQQQSQPNQPLQNHHLHNMQWRSDMQHQQEDMYYQQQRNNHPGYPYQGQRNYIPTDDHYSSNKNIKQHKYNPQQRVPIDKRSNQKKPHEYEESGNPMNYSDKPHGPKIDPNETEEFNSMLNMLGIQIGNETGIPSIPDDEKSFISKELYLLDDNCLKTFTKDSNGSYFSNMKKYGDNIVKTAIDKIGKYLAVCFIIILDS